jgi:hypothetical protein
MTERIERTQDLYLIDMTGEPTPLPAEEGQIRFVDTDIKAFVGGAVVSLISGSGITEAQHQNLDTLDHWVDENSYDELTRTGGKVTHIVVWDSPSKLIMIREELITRVSGKVSQLVAKQYDRGTGLLKETMTEVYTRTGGKVTSITRTRVP